MYRIYMDRPLREELSKKGMQRAAGFSCERSAEKLHEIYKAVLR
jgi:glycosyltransferase involved in cell wall biosynthesis